MKTVVKQPGLVRRGNRWYLRRRVPPDLVEVLGCEEIKRSLKTSDRQEAIERFRMAAVEIDQQFSVTRRKLGKEEQPLTELEAKRMALAWFAEVDRRAADRDFTNFGSEMIEGALEGVQDDASVLQFGDEAEFGPSVYQEVVKILERNGWPTEPFKVFGKTTKAKKIVGLDLSSAGFAALHAYVRRGLLETSRRSVQRLRGHPVRPVDSFFVTPFPQAESGLNPTQVVLEGGGVPAPPISEILEKWLAERNPPKKTAHEWRLAVTRFVETNGDLPIDGIQKQHVRRYKELLQQMPSALPRSLRAKPLPQIVQQSQAPLDVRISVATVNKYLAAISSLVSWAQRNGYRDDNPVQGMSIADRRHQSRKRLPYSADDLGLLVPAIKSFRDSEPARFWLPLLALYTGARLEELAQLKISDMREEKGIQYIDINTVDEEKSLKTTSSHRQIPIHPELICLGLLDFVASQAEGGDGRLFIGMEPDHFGKISSEFSRSWGRFTRALGFKDRRKVFHSFRHTFIDACRAAGIDEEVRDAITGHTGGGMGRSYGSGVPLHIKQSAIESIAFDFTFSEEKA